MRFIVHNVDDAYRRWVESDEGEKTIVEQGLFDPYGTVSRSNHWKNDRATRRRSNDGGTSLREVWVDPRRGLCGVVCELYLRWEMI